MNFTQNELEYWMNQSLELARNAGSQDDVPVGAILVSSGKVLGKGLNTRNKNQNTLGHAELEAVRDYNIQHQQWRFFQPTALFVTVEPCLMCTGALLWSRVSHIYFGCRDPKNAGILSLQDSIDKGCFDHRFSKIQSGILEVECGELISGYFEKKRQLSKQKKKTLPTKE